MKFGRGFLVFLCAAYLSCVGEIKAQLAPVNVSADRLTHADNDNNNWLTYGRTYNEQRFSPLDQIKPENLNKLDLAWHADLDPRARPRSNAHCRRRSDVC